MFGARGALLVASATLAAAPVGFAKKVSGNTEAGQPWSFRVDAKRIVDGIKVPKSAWIRYQDHEYYSDNAGTVKLSHAQAKAACEDKTLPGRKSTLVSITSEPERDFVISLQLNNRHGFWLGATRDSLAENVGPAYGFAWVDGSPFKYSSWAPGEPNSERRRTGHWLESCVYQGFNNGNPSLWNDADCGKRRRWVCKRKAEWTTTDTAPTTTTTTAAPTTTTTVGPSTTTTVGPSTTTTVGPSTSTSPPATTTSPPATTTTEGPSTTTTTPDPTFTTTPVVTTSTTAAASTTTTGVPTTTTTAAPTTSTTVAPTTEAPLDLGLCGRKSWNLVGSNSSYDFCCYRYFSPKKTFYQAEAQCQAYGARSGLPHAYGRLAGVWSEEINSLLYTIRQGQSDSSWIGGLLSDDHDHDGHARKKGGHRHHAVHGDEFPGHVDLDDDHVPRWMAARPPSWMDVGRHYTNWYPDEPSHYSGGTRVKEECVAMGKKRKGNPDKWNDASCTKKKGYFCEICVDPPTTTTAGPSTTTTAGPSTTTTADPSTTTTAPPSSTATSTAPAGSETTTTTAEPAGAIGLTSASAGSNGGSGNATAGGAPAADAPTTTTTDGPADPTTAPTSAAANTTTTTTSTNPPPECESILCSNDCGYPAPSGTQPQCGWSTRYGLCVSGGYTRPGELNRGTCSETITTTTPVPKYKLPFLCARIKCSNQCMGQCGWSSKHSYCKVGAKTRESELDQGDCT